MTSSTRLIVASLASAVLAGGAGYWIGHHWRDTVDSAATEPDVATEETALPLPVQIATVGTGTLEEVATAYGVVQPRPSAMRTYSIPFEGAVQSVAVAPGERVAKDAALLVLGASVDTQLQYQQADNALAAAQETLKQTKRRVDEQLATNSELAGAEQAVKAAQTPLDSLKARGANGPRTITADVAGIVDQVNVQPGQVAPAGSPLITVRPEHEVEVKLGVTPALSASITSDQAITLVAVTSASLAPASTPTDDGHDVVGKVRFVSPQVNAQTRLVDVYVSVPVDAKLTQGTYVTGRWTTRSVTGLVVPRDATRQVEGDWSVFVVSDEKAQQRVVTLGVQQEDRIQVIGDLHDGESVITTTNGELEDGVAVEVESAEGAETPLTPTTSEDVK